MDGELAALIKHIHALPTKTVIYATGGGVQVPSYKSTKPHSNGLNSASYFAFASTQNEAMGFTLLCLEQGRVWATNSDRTPGPRLGF